MSRAFNREFKYYPVVVVFRYAGSNKEYIAFSHAHRSDYKQKARDGEKIGKVTLLRDIDISNTHRGHIDILNSLSIKENKSISSLRELNIYWGKQFNVQVLNKTFYRELSNWYFWALRHVSFPNEPSSEKAHEKGIDKDALIKEHNSFNLIRLLTRLLFTWFIKHKGLIPDELFDINLLKQEVLKDYDPPLKTGIIFQDDDRSSIYYKAILQNLFFATLNCPIKGNELDQRKRGFRLDSYGANRGVNHLLRYKKYFKDPNKFLKILNDKVPFLNGGLFECLDKKQEKKYIDGFSDGMTKGERLVVPDFLFFGKDEEADLSEDYGVKNKGTRNAAVKGIINIFNSYVFTTSENTPLEEEIALDPELLGRVFENLLASVNPETKVTARKKTGSFYTPREIVSYMVDNSLKITLKNKIEEYLSGRDRNSISKLDDKLEGLISWSDSNPFASDQDVARIIVESLDQCKILDPACGSGAFPMGILQKMVHILKKIDPNNKLWKEVQLDKARTILETAIETENKVDREEKISQINKVFNDHINDPDYARKLYIIENGIFGVDIQPIATQIARLRFFISLIIDQKVNADSDNFGIQPLPNLELNFVSADTLTKLKLNDTIFRKIIEPQLNELEAIRHKLYSAMTPTTKDVYRNKDKKIRNEVKRKLEENGLSSESASVLAGWDPNDYTSSASFFDHEWMLGVKGEFDIVIGNPPYIQLQKMIKKTELLQRENYEVFSRMGDIYFLFFERGLQLLKNTGILCYITSNKWLRIGAGSKLRVHLSKNNPLYLIDLGANVFESATVDTSILMVQNEKVDQHNLKAVVYKGQKFSYHEKPKFESMKKLGEENWVVLTDIERSIKEKIERNGTPFRDWNIEIRRGVTTGFNKAFIIDGAKKDELIKKDPKSVEIIRPILRGRNIKRYGYDFADEWLINTHNGLPGRYKGIDVNEFPAIKEHLDKFYHQLETRQDQGSTPYNLRSCSYIDNFNKQKIIWPDISQKPSFFLDQKGFFITNTVSFMTGFNITYLAGYLNSKISQWYFKLISSELSRTPRWLKYTVSKLPIIGSINSFVHGQIEAYVIEIQKSIINSGDTITQDHYSKKIDSILYKVLELKDNEIEFIDKL